MSIRSMKRGIAKEIMEAKGYKNIYKRGRGDKKKGQFRDKKYATIGSGSFFSAFWREALGMKDNNPREVRIQNERETMHKDLIMMMKMRKKGRSVADISRIMHRKEAYVKNLLYLPLH